MTKLSEHFPLPHVSVTLTDTNVVVAEFYGRGAELRGSALCGALDVECDLSVSDEYCPRCKETFWHEAPASEGGYWRCPNCKAILNPEDHPAIDPNGPRYQRYTITLPGDRGFDVFVPNLYEHEVWMNELIDRADASAYSEYADPPENVLPLQVAQEGEST